MCKIEKETAFPQLPAACSGLDRLVRTGIVQEEKETASGVHPHL
jgi:hypothetical protein